VLLEDDPLARVGAFQERRRNGDRVRLIRAAELLEHLEEVVERLAVRRVERGHRLHMRRGLDEPARRARELGGDAVAVEIVGLMRDRVFEGLEGRLRILEVIPVQEREPSADVPRDLGARLALRAELEPLDHPAEDLLELAPLLALFEEAFDDRERIDVRRIAVERRVEDLDRERLALELIHAVAAELEVRDRALLGVVRQLGEATADLDRVVRPLERLIEATELYQERFVGGVKGARALEEDAGALGVEGDAAPTLGERDQERERLVGIRHEREEALLRRGEASPVLLRRRQLDQALDGLPVRRDRLERLLVVSARLAALLLRRLHGRDPDVDLRAQPDGVAGEQAERALELAERALRVTAGEQFVAAREVVGERRLAARGAGRLDRRAHRPRRFERHRDRTRCFE
jgi:hypothetical protein